MSKMESGSAETTRFNLFDAEPEGHRSADAATIASDFEAFARMTGIQFESYLNDMFAKLGYISKQTRTSGDYGADLILEKPGAKIAVQAKRYSKKVGFDAVKEAHAGMLIYDADEAWVVTNSAFTDQARTAAEKMKVNLVDGAKLKALMVQASARAANPSPSEDVMRRYMDLRRHIEIDLMRARKSMQFGEDLFATDSEWYNRYGEAWPLDPDFINQHWSGCWGAGEYWYDQGEVYRAVMNGGPNGYDRIKEDWKRAQAKLIRAIDGMEGLLRALEDKTTWMNRSVEEAMEELEDLSNKLDGEKLAAKEEFEAFYVKASKTPYKPYRHASGVRV